MIDLELIGRAPVAPGQERPSLACLVDSVWDQAAAIGPPCEAAERDKEGAALGRRLLGWGLVCQTPRNRSDQGGVQEAGEFKGAQELRLALT